MNTRDGVNIEIIKAFVKLRKLLVRHKGQEKKIQEMETKYDEQFRVVFEPSGNCWLKRKKLNGRSGFEGMIVYRNQAGE